MNYPTPGHDVVCTYVPMHVLKPIMEIMGLPESSKVVATELTDVRPETFIEERSGRHLSSFFCLIIVIRPWTRGDN